MNGPELIAQLRYENELYDPRPGLDHDDAEDLLKLAEALIAALREARDYVDAWIEEAEETLPAIALRQRIRALLPPEPEAVSARTPDLPKLDVFDITRRFHETYERLAPELGYTTRPETAVAWRDVPEPNKTLMLRAVDAAVSPVLAWTEALIAALRDLTNIECDQKWCQKRLRLAEARALLPPEPQR